MKSIRRIPGAIMAAGTAGALTLTLAGPVAAQPNTTPPTTITQAQEQDTLPPLMITELAPDHGGVDHFEFIELHNTTESEISMKDAGYSLAYTSADDGVAASIVLSPHEGDDIVIEAGETVVLWLSHEGGNVRSFDYTETDFREEWGMGEDGRVIRIVGQNGMSNSGDRGVQVVKNGEVESWAYYDADTISATQTAEFAIPAADAADTRRLRQIANEPGGTAGAVSPEQFEAPEPEVAEEGIPALMITEILPNSTSHDNFEYYEIHNTTNETINVLEDGYSFQYIYVNSDDMSRDLLHPVEEGVDIVLEPGETAVAWVSYTANNID